MWTQTYPNEEGFYWWRCDEGLEPEVVEIVKTPSGLVRYMVAYAGKINVDSGEYWLPRLEKPPCQNPK